MRLTLAWLAGRYDEPPAAVREDWSAAREFADGVAGSEMGNRARSEATKAAAGWWHAPGDGEGRGEIDMQFDAHDFGEPTWHLAQIAKPDPKGAGRLRVGNYARTAVVPGKKGTTREGELFIVSAAHLWARVEADFDRPDLDSITVAKTSHRAKARKVIRARYRRVRRARQRSAQVRRWQQSARAWARHIRTLRRRHGWSVPVVLMMDANLRADRPWVRAVLRAEFAAAGLDLRVVYPQAGTLKGTDRPIDLALTNMTGEASTFDTVGSDHRGLRLNLHFTTPR